jgi:hypothetical protein
MTSISLTYNPELIIISSLLSVVHTVLYFNKLARNTHFSQKTNLQFTLQNTAAAPPRVFFLWYTLISAAGEKKGIKEHTSFCGRSVNPQLLLRGGLTALAPCTNNMVSGNHPDCHFAAAGVAALVNFPLVNELTSRVTTSF